MAAPGFSIEQKAAWAERMDAALFYDLLQIATIRRSKHGFSCRLGDELRLLYVDPAAQRNGEGRRLLRDVERAARAGGLHQLRLVTAANAVGFYERCGFAAAGRESLHLAGQAVERIRMTKAL